MKGYKTNVNTSENDDHPWVTIYFHNRSSLLGNLLQVFTDGIITEDELKDCKNFIDKYPKVLDQSCARLTYYICADYCN